MERLFSSFGNTLCDPPGQGIEGVDDQKDYRQTAEQIYHGEYPDFGFGRIFVNQPRLGQTNQAIEAMTVIAAMIRTILINRMEFRQLAVRCEISASIALWDCNVGSTW